MQQQGARPRPARGGGPSGGPASDRPPREWEGEKGEKRAADRDLGGRGRCTSAVGTDGESPNGGVARQRFAGEDPADLNVRRRRSETARSVRGGVQDETARARPKPPYLTGT